MDTQIIKWQAMWNEQKIDTPEVNELIQRINRIEVNAKIRRVAVSGLALFLIIFSVWKFSELLSTPYFLISYVFIFAGIAIKLIPLYKSKYGLLHSKSDLNNRDFIKKLCQKANYSNRHLIIWMFTLFIGLNITLLGSYEKGSIFNYEVTDNNRVYFHLATIVLFVVAYLNNKRRLDNTKKKVSRLIRDLEDNNF